jgi:hypothetical protein
VREELLGFIDGGLQRLRDQLRQQGEPSQPAPAGPGDAAAQPAAPKAGGQQAGRLHYSVVRSMMEGEGGGPPLSWAQLRAMCLLMFFAGHDTSSSTLALLLWRLAGCPGALERLRREQQVGGGPGLGRGRAGQPTSCGCRPGGRGSLACAEQRAEQVPLPAAR